MIFNFENQVRGYVKFGMAATSVILSFEYRMHLFSLGKSDIDREQVKLNGK